MKDELKVPEKPKNNSIHKFMMDIQGDSVNSFNYEGVPFIGFDDSDEDLDQEDEICETNLKL